MAETIEQREKELQKTTRQQIIQSEKLASVGRLSAGIAHEINNPLTAIVANTQLLQQNPIEDEDILEGLQLIELAGNRAAKVVGNLLNLARKDQYSFISADINNLISESLDLLDHEIKANSIKLRFIPGEDLPPLQLSREQIVGVWTNLVINGIDAQKEEDSGLIEIKTFADDEFVSATFRDHGYGLSPERIQRIFEPFFTTKDTGQGTGLGLTICQKVIKQHGGQISVDSKVGEGTMFTVRLPYSN
jgi:two-component system NtrC family sensor kinase